MSNRLCYLSIFCKLTMLIYMLKIQYAKMNCSSDCSQMKAVEDHKGSLLLYRISTHKGSLLHFTETHDVGNGKGAKS